MEAMTGTPKTARAALDRLANALVEDILCASDEDILAEFQEDHGDPERHAAGMCALFERNLIAANKGRLEAARAGVAANRRPTGAAASVADIANARARIRAVLDAPGFPHKLTLAARKESELSDADILGMLDDLRELGVLPPEDNVGGSD
jgi:hypothetical protein